MIGDVSSNKHYDGLQCVGKIIGIVVTGDTASEVVITGEGSIAIHIYTDGVLICSVFHTKENAIALGKILMSIEGPIPSNSNQLDRMANALDRLVEKFCKDKPGDTKDNLNAEGISCPHCCSTNLDVYTVDHNWLPGHQPSRMIEAWYQCNKCVNRFIVHYQAISVEKLKS